MLKHIILVSSIVALSTACGGGKSSNNPQSIAPSTSSSSFSLSVSSVSSRSSSSLSSNISSSTKSSSSSSNVAVSVEAIDCSRLNPNKVYLLGTLQEGSGGEALADPSDPTKFCVGFDSNSVKGVISSSGEYIHAQDNNSVEFYRFTPETMTLSINGTWEYPKNTLANDALLFSAATSACGVRTILLQPASGEIYYSCPNDVIHSQTTKNYYYLNNDRLLGIMPDGSLLISSFMGLRLVDKSLKETNLTLPANNETFGINWIQARLFKDPITGHDSVWVANYDNFRFPAARRFTLDIISQKLTFDGEFAATPPGMDNEYVHVLDGEGSLWQINTDSEGNDVIIKRPLNSSGEQATVIYNEANDIDEREYQFKKKLFVRIHASSLVTGQ